MFELIVELITSAKLGGSFLFFNFGERTPGFFSPTGQSKNTFPHLELGSIQYDRLLDRERNQISSEAKIPSVSFRQIRVKGESRIIFSYYLIMIIGKKSA
ncbi:MAG: hypothetical protein DRJ11_07385 [Candidatus Aminicenantes bacterium]|nr:MAG: hypothetical protein DRJ11_07385 [Candidatus Aminicenantes bacterium]